MVRESIAHSETGIELSVLRAGTGAARVVFVHGTPGSARGWRGFLSAPPPGYELIAVDRPGFGLTRPAAAETRLATQSAVLEPLLDASSRPILVGHSLGGAVVLDMAARFPEKVAGVLVVAGALDPDLEHVYGVQRLVRQRAVRWLLPRALANANDELIAFETELRDLAKRLDRVRAPVILLHGTEDTRVPYMNVEFMQRELCSARSVSTVTLQGAGHALPWRNSDVLWEGIRRLSG